MNFPFLILIKFFCFCLINSVLTMPIGDDFSKDELRKKSENEIAKLEINDERGAKVKAELFDEQFWGKRPGQPEKLLNVATQVKQEAGHEKDKQSQGTFNCLLNFGGLKKEIGKINAEEKPLLLLLQQKKNGESSSSESDGPQKCREKEDGTQRAMGHKRQRTEVSTETSALKRLRIGEGNEEKSKTNSQSEESEEKEIGNYYPGETESSSNADESSSYKAESWESEESKSQDKWPRANRWESQAEFDEEEIVEQSEESESQVMTNSEEESESREWADFGHENCYDESAQSEGRDSVDFNDDASDDSEETECEDLEGTNPFPKRTHLERKTEKRTYPTDEQRMEIVNKFMEMKNRFYESGEKRPFRQVDKEIADKLDVNARTIYKWKKRFGLKLGENRKIGILKKINELKSKNPQITLAQIEKELPTLGYYRKDFKESYKQLETIRKFDKIVAKKVSPLSFEEKTKIAAELGVKIRTLYDWKKKLGINEERGYGKKEKIAILKRYDQIKKENPQKTMGQIVKEMQVSQSMFYLWRKEFKVKIKPHFLSEDEKRKIVAKFNKIKEIKGQSIKREDKKKIAKRLGFSLNAILRWKNQFGQKESRTFELYERMELLKKYYKIKDKHPKMGDKTIAKKLGICAETLRKWKNALAEGTNVERKEAEEKRAAQKPKRQKLNRHSQHHVVNGNGWKWNFSTKERNKNKKFLPA